MLFLLLFVCLLVCVLALGFSVGYLGILLFAALRLLLSAFSVLLFIPPFFVLISGFAFC